MDRDDQATGHDKPAAGTGAPGEHWTPGGEDIAKMENEAGRHDTGTQGPTERPVGESTGRDVTGVSPREPGDYDRGKRDDEGQ